MANFDWEAEREKMFARRAEAEDFAAEYAASPSGVYHAHQQALREAAFQARMDSGLVDAQTQLAAEIQKNAPGIPLESAHVLAARRLGIIQ